ncbi:acetyltransferase [Parahaliea maris]|uniref:Acetyltransferase n=2 Tax=Parahaliea maris TaxID=2716870 RepID=A0A5C9A8M3_9GAMM|nr:acetyltransferase [Parahaliea maris]
MLLRHRSTGHIVSVSVSDLQRLCHALHQDVMARDQVGEEEQDPEAIAKGDLVFLSGEALPRCWTDPNYREPR